MVQFVIILNVMDVVGKVVRDNGTEIFRLVETFENGGDVIQMCSKIMNELRKSLPDESPFDSIRVEFDSAESANNKFHDSE